MFRLTAALSAAFVFAAAAAAMPSDLPWNVYACKDGKGVAVKFLSDGLTIGVLFGKDEVKDPRFEAAPVDEDSQAGFKPGVYKATDQDVTLTMGADKAIAIEGKAVPKGPYAVCKATGKTFGGDGG